jgi:hypothetical protein
MLFAQFIAVCSGGKIWQVSSRQRLSPPNLLIFLHNHIFGVQMREGYIFQQVSRILWLLGHYFPQLVIMFLRFYKLR